MKPRETTHGDVEGYVLESGKDFSANCGIIGLGPDFNEIHNGYDSTDYVREEKDEDGWVRFTPAEAVEVADYMIQQWRQFRAYWAAKVPPV